MTQRFAAESSLLRASGPSKGVRECLCFVHCSSSSSPSPQESCEGDAEDGDDDEGVAMASESAAVRSRLGKGGAREWGSAKLEGQFDGPGTLSRVVAGMYVAREKALFHRSPSDTPHY